MRRFSRIFPQHLTRRHISTNADATRISSSFDDLTIDQKVRAFGILSMLTAWTSWVVADRLDPLRADRNGGPGHMGGWLFLATAFFETGRIPACVAVVATISNLFCVRNPLSAEEKKALDQFASKNR